MNAITRIIGWGGNEPERHVVSSVPSECVDAAIEAGKGYSRSRIRTAERNARLGLLFGAVGVLTGVVCLSGAALMLPLKRNVDHWLLADPKTGIPYELPDFSTAVKQAPKAFDLYFSQKYVEARESWYIDQALRNRALVSWSTGTEEMNEYLRQTDGKKNPDSPVAAIGAKGFIDSTVVWSDCDFDKATGRYTSKVRFKRRAQMYGAPIAPLELWYAEFTWEKHPESVPQQGRSSNPLGMIVVHYHSQKDGV